jgi:sugar-specific transcriptional regulator TrmB
VAASEDILDRLVELGLNRLEAEVYTFLLANRPMTAYRVAKHLGRPTANTYKAIEALARRGAVLVEEGENRLCRAVPAAEFLRHLEQGFLSQTREAATALAQLLQQSDDERVYRLESAPQLLERCRQMLERCERVAVVDAFPQALAAVQPAVADAVERGIRVHVQAYTPVHLPGAVVAQVDIGQQAVEHWGSQQLNIAVDGRECVIALLSHDLAEVYQGLWSNSLYLSCLLHSGMLSEQTLHHLRDLGESASGDDFRAVLARHPFFLNSDVPGQRELLTRYLRGSKSHGVE